jgi:hypothetical protein
MFGTLIIENRRNEGLTLVLCSRRFCSEGSCASALSPFRLSRISDTPEKQDRPASSLADGEEEWMVSAKDGNWRR